MKELRTLLPYLRPYRRTLAWSLALVAVANVLATAMPLLLKHGIESLKGAAAGGAHALTVCVVLLFACAALRFVTQTLFRHALFGIARRVEFDLRNDLFAALLALDAPFYGRMPTGDILSRATNDLDGVRMLLGFGLMSLVSTVFLGVLALAGMLWISPRLTAVAVLPLAILALVVRRFGHEMHHRSQEVQEQLARVSTRAQENFAGVRVVKAFAQEEAEVAAFGRLNEETLRKNLALVRVSGIAFAAMSLVAELGVLGTLVLCGYGILEGRYTVGDFLAFVAYQFMLVWPMIALGWTINLLQRAEVSMGRINAVLRARPEVADPPGAADPGEVRGGIEVRDLRFRYPGAARDALAGISFHVRAGERIGVVGRTGAGKSTLLSLFARVYPVPDGAVLLDGQDVNRLSLRGLRARIGYVPQDAFLFSDRIRSNIAYGREAEVLDEVVAAARLSRLDAEIEGFPDRYDQLIGERGVTLSGGQKQRATLARATIVGPRVLLLDDVFANVDFRTEHEILDRWEEWLRGRTVLLAGHRLAGIRRCDRILVLDGGALADAGTHDELLARGGIYRELWERQRLREELESLAQP